MLMSSAKVNGDGVSATCNKASNCTGSVAGLNSDIQVGAELINFVLDLLAKPSGLYEKLTDSGRRHLKPGV